MGSAQTAVTRGVVCLSWAIWLLQSGTAAIASQGEIKGVIEGVVANEITGEPLRRASVVLTGEVDGRRVAPVTIETLGDGAFRFEGLEAGTYSVLARKAGFLVPMPGGQRSGFRLASGQQRSGMTLKLSPQGVISGAVFDEEGEPVLGAEVQVLGRQGRGRWQPGNLSLTNDRGEFRFPSLEAGEYTVRAKYVDPLLAVKSGAAVRLKICRTTFYPNATELRAAQWVVVRKGEESAGIHVRLRKEAAYRIRVRVVSEDVERPNISLLGPGGAEELGPASRTSVPGVFELLGVPAGTWDLLGTGYTEHDEWRTGSTRVEVTNEDLNDVVLTLGAGRPLSGTFVFEGPATKRPRWQSLSINLRPTAGGREQQSTCSVKENGVFDVHYQLPGKYTISPDGKLPEGVYLASIKVGSQEYYGKELDLNGAPPETVTILYRDGSAHVSGKLDGVVGECAEERGYAVPTSVETHLRQWPYVRSEPIQLDGSFAFTEVRPGEYVAHHTVRYDPGGEPAGSSERVKVESGGRYTVSVKSATEAQKP